jgi:hypothetical protein
MEKEPRHSLMDDLLTESAPLDFRAQVLEETIRCARTRKRLRQARSTLAVVTVVVASAIGIWRWQGPASAPGLAGRSDPPVARPEMMSGLQVVQTSAELPVIVSSASSEVQVVATRELAPGYSEINDDQLLVRLRNHSVVLVRYGSGTELIVSGER